KYGLGGILQIIRMTDPDLNTLALGYDLTTLGLSLNSPEPLYTTLCCPWSDAQSVVQPEYKIPSCYSLQPPNLRFQMFQRFDVETLFYIFYSMPRDVLQLAAAQELYNRSWRFHKEHKLWFMRSPEGQLQVKTTTYERGNYLVFDPERWRQDRRDDFVLVYDQLEDKTAMQEAKQQHQQQHPQQQQPPHVQGMGNHQQWRGN
ncbi:putative NOT transcription complex subunit VIP2, partial [Diplonema papillatum]